MSSPQRKYILDFTEIDIVAVSGKFLVRYDYTEVNELFSKLPIHIRFSFLIHLLRIPTRKEQRRPVRAYASAYRPLSVRK